LAEQNPESTTEPPSRTGPSYEAASRMSADFGGSLPLVGVSASGSAPSEAASSFTPNGLHAWATAIVPMATVTTRAARARVTDEIYQTSALGPTARHTASVFREANAMVSA
jgi:hypothetical protein